MVDIYDELFYSKTLFSINPRTIIDYLPKRGLGTCKAKRVFNVYATVRENHSLVVCNVIMILFFIE